MKKFFIIILAILLGACTSSQPQFEVTAQVAASQTKAAMPTVLPSLDETNTFMPLAMPPTWTLPVSSTENDLSSHICRINGPLPD